MKIGIIIINYNSTEYTLKCLNSLTKQLSKEVMEIVVVDNHSTDKRLDEIKKKFPAVTLLLNQENLGFSEGNNVGIRYVLKRGCDYILLLNNDTRVAPGFIDALLLQSQKIADKGILCPKIYFENGSETHKDRYTKDQIGKVIWYAGGIIDWKNMLASHRGVDEVDKGYYESFEKTDYATGCAMFIPKLCFDRVGLLDQKLYLYYEDLDFCRRAFKKGFFSYYVPSAVMWHANAVSSGGTGSDLQSYYITRNRLLIGMRYAPWKTKLALFREAANLVVNGTKTQREAVGDFLRKQFGKRGKRNWFIPKMPNLLRFVKQKK